MMWLMLHQNIPDDYVFATKVTNSVKDFVQETFTCLDLDWQHFVHYDARYERTAEVDLFIDNPAKAKK